jgi:hypothetical protein
MIGLAIRETEGVDLIVYESVNDVRGGRFEVMMVDDTFSGLKEALPLAKHLDIPIKVLLYHDDAQGDDGFDYRIKKPFLPEDIRTFIDGCKADLEANPPLRKPIDELDSRTKPKASKITHVPASRPEPNVLDPDEIDTIKNLLEEEGLQIVGEEELADTVIREREALAQADSKALLKFLRKTKPKKLRKLLKGATVRIEITFPEEP